VGVNEDFAGKGYYMSAGEVELRRDAKPALCWQTAADEMNDFQAVTIF
jgi:hypothetical protein